MKSVQTICSTVRTRHPKKMEARQVVNFDKTMMMMLLLLFLRQQRQLCWQSHGFENNKETVSQLRTIANVDTPYLDS
jgi:hypothetical protein